jgi:hypothetical protein
MINLTGSTPASSAVTTFAISNTKPDASTTSFAEQLASILTGYLNPSGNGSHIEIDVEAAPGQDSDTRQFVVTVKDLPSTQTAPAAPAAPSTPVTTASASASTPAPAPAQAATTPPGNAPSASASAPAAPAKAAATATSAATPTAATPPARTLASGRPVLTAADSYWASQPPEVQALRDIPDEAQRTAKAHELADQGYLIDVPIMVWNWDPLTTMVVRQNQGFTWVPSANQKPVPVAPGLTFAGLPSYDAKNIPPGAIPVTTDFAKGFAVQYPWLQDWAAANNT